MEPKNLSHITLRHRHRENSLTKFNLLAIDCVMENNSSNTRPCKHSLNLSSVVSMDGSSNPDVRKMLHFFLVLQDIPHVIIYTVRSQILSEPVQRTKYI